MNEQAYFEQFIGDNIIEITGTPLRELSLSSYTHNQLKRADVRYVVQAVEIYKNPERLLHAKYRMFGEKRLIELEKALRKFGAI